MSIHSDKNLYPGINPHLNSYLQHVTGWKGFHSKHLEHIAEALEILLPEAYYIAGEESLQIGTYDSVSDVPVTKSEGTIPDITIYRGDTAVYTFATTADASAPTLTMPVIDIPDEPEYMSSLVVYHLEEGSLPGKPTTRIELLSPANKAPGSHYKDYRVKRLKTLNSGMRLVEIDYLHERRPIDSRLPNYVDEDDEAYPYHLIVSDPRPSIMEGLAGVYSFGVVEKLPKIAIPLASDDKVTLDFDAIYNRTVESSRLFRRILVDYEQEHINFAAYSEADQQKIREYIAQIEVTHHL